MVFSELPAGSEFCFGRVMKHQRVCINGRGVWEDTLIPLIWQKTALNGLSVGIKECGYASFDYRREATGTNRYMRTHGHRLFFLSAIYKYLNCADHSWKETAQGDMAPRSDTNEGGFLSRFNEEEMRLLEPFALKVQVPPGYVKQYGTEMTKNVLVGLPTSEELGSRFSAGTFGVQFRRLDTWLRNAESMCVYMNYGSPSRCGGEVQRIIMPIIKIKADAPVDRTEDGKFIIRIPETDFAGDIAAFLGLQLETAA